MIQEIFKKVAAKYPKRPALQFESGRTFSYRQLDEWSNQMTWFFQSKGVKHGNFVIMQLERSAEQVAIFLALAKIGAVYVPISMEQPSVRTQQVIADCKPTHIIQSLDLEPDQEAPDELVPGVKIININELGKTGVHVMPSYEPETKLPVATDLLYVAYSSGSTGKPKGIPIPHGGMSGYWQDALIKNIDHPVSAVLGNVSVDFDAHVWEYLMAWVFAASIHVASESTRKDANLLAKFIETHKISDATITPSVLRIFSEKQLRQMRKSRFQAFHSTGEACTPEIIQRCTKQRIQVYNCYGPTEATFGASMTLCRLEDFHHGIAPIGFPPKESEVEMVILDDDLKPVKEGELVIISPFLSPGYLNRPKENERFFTFKTPTGDKRAYRTGDRFVQHDEHLFYKGRLSASSHLKIRGQFVDPLGTENMVRKHPEIKDVAIVVSKNQTALTGFIVTKNHKTLSPAVLRKFLLKSGLISAAIPSFWEVLDTLPLNVSGKVDRHALAKRLPALTSDSETFVAPDTPVEKRIAEVWHEILDLQEQKGFNISRDAPFPLLGGNSIRAMQMVSALQDAFDLPIIVSDMGSLEELTVQKLADILFKKKALKFAESSIVRVRSGSDPTAQPVFLIPPIAGESVFTYKPLYEALKTDRPIYAINSPTLSDPSVVASSIPAIAEAYIVLARCVQARGNLFLIGWSSGGTVAFEMGVQLEKSGSFADKLIIIDEAAPQVTIKKDQKAFSEDLMKMLAYFAEQLKFKTPAEQKGLEKLGKTEQIDTVFSDALLDTLPQGSRNLLTRTKYFLKAELNYDPSKLHRTQLFEFFTESTAKAARPYLRTDEDSRGSLGWSERTPPALVVSHSLKGDHFSIMSKAGGNKLFASISILMAAFQGSSYSAALPPASPHKALEEKMTAMTEKFDSLQSTLLEKLEAVSRRNPGSRTPSESEGSDTEADTPMRKKLSRRIKASKLSLDDAPNTSRKTTIVGLSILAIACGIVLLSSDKTPDWLYNALLISLGSGITGLLMAPKMIATDLPFIFSERAKPRASEEFETTPPLSLSTHQELHTNKNSLAQQADKQFHLD